MNDEERQRATAREWLAARIVFVGGFVIAIAVAVFFAIRSNHPAEEASIPPAQTETTQSPTQPPVSQSDEDKRVGMMVCAQELIGAKNIGIVPGDAQLAALEPRGTKVRYRYECLAATSAEKYIIAADLRCKTLTDSQCVQVHDVTTHDGTVLYQRQQ